MNYENKNTGLQCRKHITLEEAVEWRKQCKQDNKKLVFVNGCFDLIHPGHLRLLQEAKALGDFLLVGLNSDDSIRRLKGRGRPVMPLEARLFLFCCLEMVDRVIVFEEDTPHLLLKALQPDYYVKGTGWNAEQLTEIRLVEEYGGRSVLMESLAAYSTSKIIRKIRSIPADLL